VRYYYLEFPASLYRLQDPNKAMAQLFGKDFGTIDIAGVFATCIFCLNYASGKAPNEKECVRVGLVRLRLTRWGEAVNIYKDPKLDDDYVDDIDDGHVRRILIDMLDMFEACSTKTKEEAPSLAPQQFGRLPREAIVELETVASERFKGQSLLSPGSFKLAEWHPSLVLEVARMATELEAFIPAAQEQRKLWASEKKRFANADVLDFLVSVSSDLSDVWMSNRLVFTNVDNDHGFVTVGAVIAGNVVGTRATFINGTITGGTVFSGDVIGSNVNFNSDEQMGKF
jgi:hypothetical protein